MLTLRRLLNWFSRVVLRRKPRLVYHCAVLTSAILPDNNERGVAIIHKRNPTGEDIVMRIALDEVNNTANHLTES